MLTHSFKVLKMCLAMDLFGTCAVKVSVNFCECWAFAVITVFQAIGMVL